MFPIMQGFQCVPPAAIALRPFEGTTFPQTQTVPGPLSYVHSQPVLPRKCAAPKPKRTKRLIPLVEGDKVVANRFRTKICRNYMQSENKVCPFESRCMFAHGEQDLRTPAENLRDGLVSEAAIQNFKRRLAESAAAQTVMDNEDDKFDDELEDFDCDSCSDESGSQGLRAEEQSLYDEDEEERFLQDFEPHYNPTAQEFSQGTPLLLEPMEKKVPTRQETENRQGASRLSAEALKLLEVGLIHQVDDRLYCHSPYGWDALES